MFPPALGAMMMGNMTKLNTNTKMIKLSMTKKRRNEKYDRIPAPNIPVTCKRGREVVKLELVQKYIYSARPS